MPNAHPRPWHRGSLFGPGARRPLNREQRAKFKFLLGAHRRAKRLTACTVDVGEALLRRLGVDGQLDPSHSRLAVDAGCSDRTVRRAIVTMRALGLLRWQTRLVRDGWRTEQTSSAYELCPDGTPPMARCGGQNDRESRLGKIQVEQPALLPPPSMGDLAAARAALERRQAVIEGRLLRNGRV